MPVSVTTGWCGWRRARSKVVGTVALAVSPMLLAAAAGVASAQSLSIDETQRRGAVMGGVSLGDGEPAPAISATLGWYARHLGVEFELTYARKLDFTLDLCPSPQVCVIGGKIPVTGRTVMLIPHLVFDLASPAKRVRPYVVAGVGFGHLRQWYDVNVNAGGGGGEGGEVQRKRSKHAAALSFGGGIAVQASRRVALGVDVRSVRLFDDEASPERFIEPAGTLTTLRVGARASLAF